MVKTSKFDVAEYLDTKELQEGFLDSVAEDGSPDEILEAMKIVANARGMSKSVRDAGIAKESLYKSFSSDENPTLDTLSNIAKSIGYKLNISFTPLKNAH